MNEMEALRELRGATIAYAALTDQVHRMYGSTATCHGGIGGQALTPHCAITCDNPKHVELQRDWDEARHRLQIVLAKTEEVAGG